MTDKPLPVGTMLRLNDKVHVYNMIVLDYFPVIVSGKEMWHHTLHFFRDGTSLGVLAFSENELKGLFISGEAEVLSKGTSNEN